MKNALLLSFFIGFITSSPIGPIGLLCLRRTLSQGSVIGILSASGISCAYAFWAYASIHGLKAISQWVEQEKIILHVAIGLFFFLYGLNEILNTPKIYYPTLERKAGVGAFLSTFLVVFLNPSTFIMFSVLFTLLGITSQRFDLFNSLEIALSVFAGSIVFWISMSQIISRTIGNMRPSIYNSISRISSYAIMIFGIAILLYYFLEH